MFQTNQPDFDSTPENSAIRHEMHVDANGPNKVDKENCSIPTPEFATLKAFTTWLDGQLAELEANHEGFETASSVRGFFGR